MAKRTADLRAQVREVLNDELKGILHDVSYRLGVLYDAVERTGRIGSRDLNLAVHQLDGFTLTDNSPATGKVAWSDCNIVYKGVNYAITDGSTDNKYIWWQFAASPNTVFQTSATKPALTDDDVLVAINNGGTHQLVIGSGRMTSGAAILDGSVDGSAIGSGAITEGKIAALAITEAKLASGAVTSGKIGSGAVESGALASGAVTEAKLASGAVTSGKIGSGAVAESNLASGAVTEGKIAGSAVTSGKIASGAVGATQLAGSAVTSDKLASGAVTSAKIAEGAVGSTQIGAGAVATDKLNTALHMIF